MTGQLEIAEEATKVNDMEAASNVMTRCLMRPRTIAVCTANLLATAVCRQTTAKPPAEIRAGHQVGSRVPANMLAELNGSLQELASKVSPAVVQIEVTRFGPAQDEDRKDMVVMVRQHAIGNGVTVDLLCCRIPTARFVTKLALS